MVENMSKAMDCYYLYTSTVNNDEVQRLVRNGSDSLFLVDRMGILRGKMSTRAYVELSKFFELHVMSYPRSLGQLEDALISGAASVVVPPDIPFEVMEEMTWLTENIILPFTGQAKALEFEKVGGTRYLARSTIPVRYESLYYVGQNPPGDNAIVLSGFPEEMNNATIF